MECRALAVWESGLLRGRCLSCAGFAGERRARGRSLAVGGLARTGCCRGCRERGLNNADFIGRVAATLRLGRAEAEAAVDTVFQAIGESLAREEAVRIARFGTLATGNRKAPCGPDSGNQGHRSDTGLESTGVQAGQGVEGHGGPGSETGSRGAAG